MLYLGINLIGSFFGFFMLVKLKTTFIELVKEEEQAIKESRIYDMIMAA